VSVAAALMSVTVILMLLMSQTPLASLGLALYDLFPLLGVAVFGVFISLGRHFGMKGLLTDENQLALAGIALSVFGYGWFGGSILSPFETRIYVPAIAIAGVITIGLTLLATIIIFGTDYNFSGAGLASAVSFGIGIVLVLIISFISSPILAVIGFGFFLLGFLLDLVYEIYLTSTGRRTPVANGLGVYIAFAGVFVHILQIVLRALARD